MDVKKKTLSEQVRDLVYPYAASLKAQVIVVICLLLLILSLIAAALFVRWRRGTFWIYQRNERLRPNYIIITFLLFSVYVILALPCIGLTYVQEYLQQLGPGVDILIVVSFLFLHYIQFVTVWGNCTSNVSTNGAYRGGREKRNWKLLLAFSAAGVWSILSLIFGMLLEVEHLRTDVAMQELIRLLDMGIKGLALVKQAEAHLRHVGDLATIYFRVCLGLYVAWAAIFLPIFIFTTFKTYKTLTSNLNLLQQTASAAEYRTAAATTKDIKHDREVLEPYVPESRIRAKRLARVRLVWIVNMASLFLVSLAAAIMEAMLFSRSGPFAASDTESDNYRIFAYFSYLFIVFGMFSSSVFLYDSFKARITQKPPLASRGVEESDLSIVLSPDLGRFNHANLREGDYTASFSRSSTDTKYR